MTLVADLPLAERFAYCIGGLQKLLWWAGPQGLIGAPAAWMLLYNRLSRMRARFTLLVERFRAGTLTAPRQRKRSAAERKAAAPRPSDPVPRGIAWLLRLKPAVPHLLGGFAGCRCHLEEMLGDAELKALLAATPQAGRILRPLCHMLGIRPTPELKLPPRQRRVRPKARRRERAPKPIDVTKLSSVAYGNIIHPEREPMGWRPPNRIGYARPKPFPK